MDPSNLYKINSPGVVSETFEDEVVVINLESGNYYSFNKTGAAVWGLIGEGYNVQTIIDTIKNSYSDDSENIETDIISFLNDLLSNEILVKTDNHPPLKNQKPNPDEGIEQSKSFEPPLLQKYTDMQELLLLDPIHEVDETGWPSQTENSTD
jgi:hypothetical protein